MNSAPQIRLRTIFLLFTCAAVGLTTSSKPLGAIRATIEVAIAIGLLQQAWQLCYWRTLERSTTSELSFARQFAIFWRIAVAITLGGCIVWRILLARQFIASRDLHNFLIIEPLD